MVRLFDQLAVPQEGARARGVQVLLTVTPQSPAQTLVKRCMSLFTTELHLRRSVGGDGPIFRQIADGHAATTQGELLAFLRKNTKVIKSKM